MDFRITGLPAHQFAHYSRKSDEELLAHNARRYRVDAPNVFPDRIALRHGRVGETVLLVNYTHQAANSPYRASHAIFVLEGDHASFDAVNDIPEVMRPRTLSLRAFDGAGMLVQAELAEGARVEPAIECMLANPKADYLHAHFAKHGCFAARIDRA